MLKITFGLFKKGQGSLAGERGAEVKGTFAVLLLLLHSLKNRLQESVCLIQLLNNDYYLIINTNQEKRGRNLSGRGQGRTFTLLSITGEEKSNRGSRSIETAPPLRAFAPALPPLPVAGLTEEKAFCGARRRPPRTPFFFWSAMVRSIGDQKAP